MTVETSSRPTVQGSAFQIRNETGVGKAESDGPKSAAQHAPPEGQVLVEQAALEAVERAQRLAQHVDRLGARAAEAGRRGDRLLDRIDRRQMGDEERDVDADEDHQHELGQPLADVGQVSLHALCRAVAVGGRRADPPPAIGLDGACAGRSQFCAIFFGLSLTNMYLVFAQFGTGSV